MLTFPIKRTGETLPISFDFSTELADGENLTSCNVVSTTFAGTDPTPAAVIQGGASVALQPYAIQKVTGGLDETSYLLTATGVTDALNTYIIPAILPVSNRLT